MKGYFVSIVASIGSAPYDGLEVGDVLQLQIDHFNKVDPNAVAVLKDGCACGYVANSPVTLLPDTQSATDLKKNLSLPKVRSATALLVDRVDFVNKAGKQQKRFLAKVFSLPVRQGKSEARVCSYEVGGVAAKNPNKTKVLEELGKGNSVELLINPVPNLGYFLVLPDSPNPGAAAGQILNPDEDLKKLVNAANRLGENVKAVATSIVETLKYEIVISGDNKIEECFDAIDNAVARGVGQVREIQGKASVMLDNGFPVCTVEKVLEQMPVYLDRRHIKRPARLYKQKNGTNLADTVSYLLMGKTLRLVGEKGTGKNTLLDTAAWLLNRPICRVQGNADLDKLDLLGSRTLQDGTTGFELSELLKTLQSGGIGVIDEANTVRPDVLTLLHSLTDGARAIDVPGYGTVKMHPRACIAYTMNEDYVGTGEMNAATIDRGPSIIVERETDMSAMLKAAVPDADEKDIGICVSVSSAVEKSVRESGELSQEAITVRGYIDALESASLIPLKRALIQNVANKAQSESERAAIKTIIESFCA